MNYKPIIIVSGEPNSIFFELFFKSIKKNYFKSPLIIIASQKLLTEQMKKLGFNFKINSINENFSNMSNLDNKKINIINVNYHFKKPFEKISHRSNIYITECFKLAFKIIKKNKYSKLINGPINKKVF